MGKNSKIEWCHNTFNPWIGCTKVSEGCANCYAAMSTRARVLRSQGWETWGKGAKRSLTSDNYWHQPVLWNRKAAQLRVKDGMVLRYRGDSQTVGRPETRVMNIDAEDGFHGEMAPAEWEALPRHRPRVFCASMADWLDEEVPVQWLVRLLSVIYLTPNLDWLLLTKRPQNWVSRIGQCVSFQEHVSSGAFYSWLRGWAEGQKPHNIWVGATAENQERFNERWMPLAEIPAKVRFWSMEPLLGSIDFTEVQYGFSFKHAFHWVICGGESGGEKARLMQPQWARDIQSQCEIHDVPFLFKQWGEYGPSGDWPDHMVRLGKKKAGRLLDGVEHSEFPKLEGRSE